MHVFRVLLFAVCFVGALVSSQLSYADILITPTRVVLEGRDRFAFVTLVNIGKATKSYEIGWVHYRMNEGAGTYSFVEDLGDDFDLSKHVVFSPRRVTLTPGAKQRVRLALQRPESIPDGDYYVNMKFKVLPDEVVDGGLPDVPGTSESKADASVKINVSYTIPVVLRVGEPDYRAEIGQIDVGRNQETGALEVHVPVSREGNYATLGWLKLFHVDADGSESLVGEVSNANIFTEISNRTFVVPLTKEVSGGGLKAVMYYNDISSNIVYAERYFPLQ